MCPIFYSIMSRAHIRGIEQSVKNKTERFSEISILLSSNEENQSGIKRSIMEHTRIIFIFDTAVNLMGI